MKKRPSISLTVRFTINSSMNTNKTYSNWAYRAINVIFRDPNPEKFQIFDVMVIDEIQDIILLLQHIYCASSKNPDKGKPEISTFRRR